MPEADGIGYDSRFLGEACVAVFDRALQRLEASTVTPLASSAETLRDVAGSPAHAAGVRPSQHAPLAPLAPPVFGQLHGEPDLPAAMEVGSSKLGGAV